jgi:hypothetical protein
MSLVPSAKWQTAGWNDHLTRYRRGEKSERSSAVYHGHGQQKNRMAGSRISPGVQEYSEMRMMPDGLVYGITDKRKFFVFDPARPSR